MRFEKSIKFNTWSRLEKNRHKYSSLRLTKCRQFSRLNCLANFKQILAEKAGEQIKFASSSLMPRDKLIFLSSNRWRSQVDKTTVVLSFYGLCQNTHFYGLNPTSRFIYQHWALFRVDIFHSEAHKNKFYFPHCGLESTFFRVNLIYESQALSLSLNNSQIALERELWGRWRPAKLQQGKDVLKVTSLMKRLTDGKDLNGDSGSSLRAPFFLSFFFFLLYF